MKWVCVEYLSIGFRGFWFENMGFHAIFMRVLKIVWSKERVETRIHNFLVRTLFTMNGKCKKTHSPTCQHIPVTALDIYTASRGGITFYQYVDIKSMQSLTLISITMLCPHSIWKSVTVVWEREREGGGCLYYIGLYIL